LSYSLTAACGLSLQIPSVPEVIESGYLPSQVVDIASIWILKDKTIGDLYAFVCEKSLYGFEVI